jgi:hypothetical protein
MFYEFEIAPALNGCQPHLIESDGGRFLFRKGGQRSASCAHPFFEFVPPPLRVKIFA